MKKRIYLSSPTIHEEEKKYVKEAFDSNWVAPLGPNVDAFEKEIISYTKAGYAAALTTGTAAIHLALKLAGVKEGDRVFVSSLTFSATCNPICYEKAIPVFIDSEPETWNMSPEALRKAFIKYPETKIVVLVNLYGIPAKLEEITNICEENNAILIEDAAESLGARYKGIETGTFGEFGIFSFNGNKIITTSGGGMLVSKYEEKIKKARFLATQAREPERHYEHKEIGYNYRMSNVLAGIGRGQLQHLEEHVEKKTKIYEKYKNEFEEIKQIQMNPYEVKKATPNFWLSCILLEENSRIKPFHIMDVLDQENIESRPIWKPMHMQPVFSSYDYFSHYKNGDNVSEKIYKNGLCLPSDIKNTEEDMKRIIRIIKELF